MRSPSLYAYLGWAVVVGPVIGLCLVMASAAATSFDDDWTPRRRGVLAVVVFIVVVAAIAGMTAFMYHASWIDYRRGTP